MPKGLQLKDAEKARDEITAEQLKRISKLYKDWADDIAKKAEKLKQKSTLSAELQERQMKELEKALRKASEKVANDVTKTVKDGMTKISQSVVYQNVDWMKSLGFPKDAITAAFSSVPDNVVRNIITGKVYGSGWSLSKSIWGDNEDTLAKIHEIVAGGMAENKPIYDIAKDLEQFVRPGAKKPWNLRTESGKLIYPKQVDYNAQRLARTLSQHSYQQSIKATSSENPFIQKVKWHSSGNRVCDICKKRDGKVFPIDELPMDHPNGFCIMEQLVDDNMDDRLLNWVSGKEDKELDKFAKKLGFGIEDMNVKGAEDMLDLPLDFDKFFKSRGYSKDNLPKDFSEWYYGFEYKYRKELLDLVTPVGGHNPNDMSDLRDLYSQTIEKLGGGTVKAKPPAIKQKASKTSAKPKVNKVKVTPSVTDSAKEYKGWLEKIKKQTEYQMLRKEEKSLKEIGKEGVNGIELYIGESFNEMNTYLRLKAVGMSEAEAVRKSQIGSSQLKAVKDMVNGLNKTKFDEDLILRRGSDLGELAALMAGDFDNNLDSISGKTVEELDKTFSGVVGSIGGFTSTSSLWDSGFDSDVEVVYYAPAGTHASSIMSISDYGADEAETILNAGTKVKVLKVEKSDGHMDSKIRIYMQILV